MHIPRKADAAKTGAGKPLPPSPFEDMVGQIVGASSCLPSGVEGKSVFRKLNQNHAFILTSEIVLRVYGQSFLVPGRM